MENKTLDTSLTEAKVTTLIRKFAFPAIMANLAGSVYNTSLPQQTGYFSASTDSDTAADLGSGRCAVCRAGFRSCISCFLHHSGKECMENITMSEKHMFQSGKSILHAKIIEVDLRKNS